MQCLSKLFSRITITFLSTEPFRKHVSVLGSGNELSIWKISDPSQPIITTKVHDVTSMCFFSESKLILGTADGYIQRLPLRPGILSTPKQLIHTRIDSICSRGRSIWFLSGECLYGCSSEGVVKVVNNIHRGIYKITADGRKLIYWLGKLQICVFDIKNKTSQVRDLKFHITDYYVVRDISDEGLVLFSNEHVLAVYDPVEHEVIVEGSGYAGHVGPDGEGLYRFIANQIIYFCSDAAVIAILRPQYSEKHRYYALQSTLTWDQLASEDVFGKKGRDKGCDEARDGDSDDEYEDPDDDEECEDSDDGEDEDSDDGEDEDSDDGEDKDSDDGEYEAFSNCFTLPTTAANNFACLRASDNKGVTPILFCFREDKEGKSGFRIDSCDTDLFA